MARSAPGTAGSKGGGNVVPTNQPTMGGRFGTLGGPGYGPNPLGSAGPRGIVAGDYTYGKGLPRRFPSQQPRYPMPRNPYSQPPNRYGGMQGPTGLGGFLSRQPAISQRQIDPATGFPARPQSYGAVMGRPDFGSIGRNASKGKSGSKGGARTVRPSEQGPVMDRQPQPDIGMDPYGTQSFKIDPDILDRGTVMNPAYRSPNQISSDRPMLFGNNPPPRLTQGLPERPMSQPTPDVPLRQLAVSGDSNNAQSSSLGRFQSQGPESLMRMGRAPNIRPAMNVGKATGGPVGLASLIGRY